MSEHPSGSPRDDSEKEDTTELLVAELMQNDGWSLSRAPFIDSDFGESAPVFNSDSGATIIPDIIAGKSGRAVFVEVKYKSSGAEWINKNQQLEHFIDQEPWHHYNEVRTKFGKEVWVVIYEADNHVFQVQEIDNLNVVGHWTDAKIQEHNGSKYGNKGVFVPQSDFVKRQFSAEKAPKHFFGQDRISDVSGFSDEFLPHPESESEENIQTDESQSGLGEFRADGSGDDD